MLGLFYLVVEHPARAIPELEHVKEINFRRDGTVLVRIAPGHAGCALRLGPEAHPTPKDEIELARPLWRIARRIGRAADAGTMPAKIDTGLGVSGRPKRALRHDNRHEHH